MAAKYIVIAAVLDFFDGFAARLLKVSSEIGKELDSMADMVSFGVAPTFIFYALTKQYLPLTANYPLLAYLPLIMIIFSAIRLAIFNIDVRQLESFIGIPTPANALFICAIPFVLTHGPNEAIKLYTSMGFIVMYPLIASYLLIAEIPLFALKFKNYSIQSNKIRYLFIISSIVLLLFFKFFGISLIILLYLLLSLVNNYIHFKNEIQSRN